MPVLNISITYCPCQRTSYCVMIVFARCQHARWHGHGQHTSTHIASCILAQQHGRHAASLPDAFVLWSAAQGADDLNRKAQLHLFK